MIYSVSQRVLKATQTDSAGLVTYLEKRGLDSNILPTELVDNLSRGATIPLPLKKAMLNAFGLDSSATIGNLKTVFRNFSPVQLMQKFTKALEQPNL